MKDVTCDLFQEKFATSQFSVHNERKHWFSDECDLKRNDEGCVKKLNPDFRKSFIVYAKLHKTFFYKANLWVWVIIGKNQRGNTLSSK
jgi:hypothetical protein